MKITKLLIVVLLAGLTLTLSGCITIKKATPKTTNLGGVFISTDRLDTWAVRSLLMTPGTTPGALTSSDVYFLRFDPADSDYMYMGTRQDGAYYSYNGGQGWIKLSKLPDGFVRDLVVDTKNKCRLFAALENRVYRSEDCGRGWKSVWFNSNTATQVTALAVDWYAPNVVYAGLSDGSFVKSVDSGSSWKLSNKFKNRVNKIIVDPNDSRVVYAGVIDGGLFRSKDQGMNWEDLNPAMSDKKDANIYYDFAVAKSPRNLIIYANKYGLLRSLDGGDTWSVVKLLSAPGAERIYSVALDPANANYIYYGATQTLYRSLDGGTSWVVKKMPTTRVPSVILAHPKNAGQILMGVKALEN